MYTTKSFSRRASLTSASVIPRRIRLRTREYVLESQYILQGRKGVPQTQHPRVTRIWSTDARTKTRTRFISEIRLVVLLCIAVERHCCGKCSGPEAVPLLSIVHSESWLKSRGLRSRALERKLPRSVYPKLFLIRSHVTIKSTQIVGTTLRRQDLFMLVKWSVWGSVLPPKDIIPRIEKLSNTTQLLIQLLGANRL